jgi:hypothetical protein
MPCVLLLCNIVLIIYIFIIFSLVAYAFSFSTYDFHKCLGSAEHVLVSFIYDCFCLYMLVCTYMLFLLYTKIIMSFMLVSFIHGCFSRVTIRRT